MPMAVFLPDVVVALVMVFVSHAPMIPRRPTNAFPFFGHQDRDKAAGVLVLVFGGGFLHPLPTDFDGTVRGEQTGIDRFKRFGGGADRGLGGRRRAGF